MRKNMCVIMVEDSQDAADIYSRAFEDSKYHVKIFNNGFDALDYLETDSTVEAVILDLALPVLDGLTIAQEIRRNENLHPDRVPVKLAILTAFDETPPITRVVEETHIERYFKKPVDPVELEREVAEWLR